MYLWSVQVEKAVVIEAELAAAMIPWIHVRGTSPLPTWGSKSANTYQSMRVLSNNICRLNCVHKATLLNMLNIGTCLLLIPKIVKINAPIRILKFRHIVAKRNTCSCSHYVAFGVDWNFKQLDQTCHGRFARLRTWRSLPRESLMLIGNGSITCVGFCRIILR